MSTTAVELNPQVVAACRLWFQLPADARAPRGAGDGRRRLRRRPARRGSGRCAAGRPLRPRGGRPVLDSEAFYRDCRALLTDDGVMTVNLFGRAPASSAASSASPPPSAPTRCGRFKPTREGNTIVLAMKHVTAAGPRRACRACRKHRNSLGAAGPQVAAHVRARAEPTRRPPDPDAAARMKTARSDVRSRRDPAACRSGAAVGAAADASARSSPSRPHDRLRRPPTSTLPACSRPAS